MSLGTSNRDGGKTSESGHLRAIYKAVAGDVLNGLAVSQRGAGVNMSVDLAIGDAIIPRSDATYGHPAFNDAVENVVITTADPTNPRHDIVVMYIDYAETPSTGVSNNTNGVVKLAVVAGTPAGSPADPSDASIQSAVGASNPYIKLARVRVAAAATSIANSVIDDLRSLTEEASGGWRPQSTAWDAWTYVGWDSTNKTATINVPDTTLMTLGQKVRYWQITGGWKYGFITKLVSSTQITVYHGTDYTLNNERMYIPAVSLAKAPQGFPLDPTKWTIVVTISNDHLKASPVAGTWYGDTALTTTGPNIRFPIGAWDFDWKSSIWFTKAATTTTNIAGSWSTSASAETDADLTAYSKLGGASGTLILQVTIGKRKTIVVTAATLYYMIVKAFNTSVGTIGLGSGAGAYGRAQAVCAYL